MTLTTGWNRPGVGRVMNTRKLIDLAGIARLLGVAPTTPQQWRMRNQLPDPDEPDFPDKPLWYTETIIKWAKATDRWPPGRVARPRARAS